MSNRLRNTDILKALAIVLITNSHLDALYPWPYLGTGGALGNAFFFMLSGYGLGLSREGRQQQQAFVPWFWRRVTRIYPALWIAVTVFVVGFWGKWRQWQGLDYVQAYLYPTTYWFISAIMLFYGIIYAVWHFKLTPRLPLIIAGLGLPYAYFYLTSLNLGTFAIEGGGYFKWLFYLQVMLLGLYLAHKPIPKTLTPQKTWVGVALCLLAYLGLKLLFARGLLLQWQFMLHLITLPLVTLALYAVQQSDILSGIQKIPAMAWLVGALATVALEIYLVQLYLYTAPWLAALPFPLNVGMFWILILPTAGSLHWASAQLQKTLGRHT